MALRIRGLAHLDPRAVPLPVGTEVCTRVDRALEDRVVPQGAVGRVHAVNDQNVDVHLVGVGIVRYTRDEVHPRKLGQARYAQRREDAWEALQPCVVLEATVGSRAWGLATPASDVDVRGVFAQPTPWAFGLVDPPDTLVSADGSTTYWEVGKAIRQALRADPNTLEMLFVPSARATDPVGQWLLDTRDAFVSSEIYGSFGRYALSQLKRLEQNLQLAELRHTVLAWLREEPAPSLDEVTSRLAKVDPRAAPTTADAELRARNHIKQLYRSLYDQGLIPARDFPALVVFARQQAPSLDLARELRPKNAYNLIRLIITAIAWLKTGEAHLEVTGTTRTQLLDIKEGRVALADVLRAAEELTPELEAARRETKLPPRADLARADELLHRVRNELARRWTEKQPGSWGADAPRPPQARWDEE
jgi:RNA repair pathway DNA polymerase beta family